MLFLQKNKATQEQKWLSWGIVTSSICRPECKSPPSQWARTSALCPSSASRNVLAAEHLHLLTAGNGMEKEWDWNRLMMDIKDMYQVPKPPSGWACGDDLWHYSMWGWTKPSSITGA